MFLWDSGDFYVGEWKDNKINGQGIIYFSSGGYLEGQFINSVVNNKSLLVFPNNDKYFANWKQGHLDGKVTMLFKGTKKQIIAIYENGQFRKVESIKENIKEVKSVKEFQQKYDISKLIQKYSALLSNGVSSNKLQDNQEQIIFSKINFQDGGFFIGITQNNIPNGLGLFQYSDQKFDCGFYKNGFLNGNGRKNFPNGDFYEGSFNQGKFEGEGLIFHKLQNTYYFGIFKDNILVNEQQKGEGYPKEMLNKQKNLKRQNGFNYNGEVVSQDWMKLSIFHNLQFIGNIGRQDQNKVLKSNQNQPNNQFCLSAHTTSRVKDNTQKYHQKNLDTVYYLNQKMRTTQNAQTNTKVSKENILQMDKGVQAIHRKNQGSLDLTRVPCIDQNFNSLQKTKSEYMTLQTFNDNNLSNFYIQLQQPLQQQQINQVQSQQQQINQTQSQQSLPNSQQQPKNEQQEDFDEECGRQRKLSTKARRQSPYLSPLSRPNSSQKQSIAIHSPQFEIKQKKILNSPQTYNLNKYNKMIGYFQQKNLIKKDLSLNSNQNQDFRAQSPIEKIQKTKNQKTNPIDLKKLNQFNKNNQQNIHNINNNTGQLQNISPLITQKSQPCLILTNSPESYIKISEHQIINQSSQQIPFNNNSDNIQNEKSPHNKIEEGFDCESQKDISIEAQRTKCDSQGDLIQYENNRTSYLSQPSIQKPKNSIATVVNLNKQQSYENKGMSATHNSYLNDTPSRQSYKSSNSQNKDKSKQNLSQNQKQSIPLQSEEAMRHYYQTRIKKQAPEEIHLKEYHLKNKLQTTLSTKNIGSNNRNNSSNSNALGLFEQKNTTQNSKIKEMEKKKNTLVNQNKNKSGQNQQQKSKLQGNKSQQQKPLKGLLSVKSQDNLVKDAVCSFSSLQEQQVAVTQPDESQKSKFFKIEQLQIQEDDLQFIQEQEQQIKNEIIQNDQKSLEQSYEFQENNENNENKNLLNQKQNYQQANIRKSDCLISNSPKKQNEKGIENIKLMKVISTENEIQNNENSQINSNKEQSQIQNNLKSTISDQIRHILHMQKVQNNQKHKFSMKPFLLQGNQSKFNQNQENRRSENQISQTLNQFSQEIQNQNTLNLQIKSKSKIDEILMKKEQYQSIFPADNLQNKQERHILTPFHPAKTPQHKEIQSTNSYQLKAQTNESIRSFNQKMSSYMSFQERINAIGQCIYKKDWNATQSFNSIASLSRNNSVIIEKNQNSEDNLNIINTFSSNNINSKEELQQKSDQTNQLCQQPLQNNVNQLVANYFQAQNNVSELNIQVTSKQSTNEQDMQSDPINIVESNFDLEVINIEQEKQESSVDSKQKHDYIFDGIVQSNYNSLVSEEKIILQQFETNSLQSSQKLKCLQEQTKQSQPEQLTNLPVENIEKQLQYEEPCNDNYNFGILKTEEGEGDSINKNDLACLQLKGMNESDLFNDQSEKSSNINELQIDQKLFNEEDLLGLNALDEIFSQNSGSMCSFTPPKQQDVGKSHFNQQQKAKDGLYFNQKIEQTNDKDLDSDLEFKNIFNFQLNLDNLDIFSINQESQSFNNQNSCTTNGINNQNSGEIGDLSGLSPINMKESNLDDQFQQEQMITEFHFYEDLLLQQKNDICDLNQKEENNKYNQKYKPILESIQEMVAEDQYTSPKKKQKNCQRQTSKSNQDLDLIVQQIQF
ncbi:MORN motif protein (macronuclear) [Tetrahymena thermophila SB210]|uniref:MORN motif protein n=1 Tax=Tetrahymena thermophila (strain SB210) TaxID=312017 RepID=I7M7C4_TETTS|nr:MORN motif protein [Tetrahymena thermophila SB210]EAR90964.2 MORN motif protein [Tetrahymena thermophila SB210]|eukprot:XP_001011209.2 MORN motif protein [Tetrahymena thermophila SB210]